MGGDRDGTLVGLSLEGSEQAYGRLVTRYQRPIFSLLVRMVRDASLAEDLAQEVFLKAFQKLHTYDRGRKFSSWLFKVAHNTAIDHLRRKRLPEVPLQTDDAETVDPIDYLAASEAGQADVRVWSADQARALEHAVGRLRVEYREAVLLRFREGLSYEEIAEITDVPLGTVKTRLHRARKELVTALTALGITPRS